MSEKKNKIKEIWAKVKQQFSATPPAPTTYKLSDGTEATIDKLEVGGVVTINGVAAPEGPHTLEDGTVVTVDAAGVITAVTPKAEPAPAATPGDMSTVEGMQTAMAKFATGTPEERITSLEVIMKAVADYCFGWQIKEAQSKADRDAAIKEYQTKLDTQQATIDQQAAVMKSMYELMQVLVDEPVASDPQTPAKKTFSFSKSDKKATAKEKMAAAFQKMEEEKQKNKQPKAA